jgi:c-di-GMP-binding flagellar brake protein YcgR
MSTRAAEQAGGADEAGLMVTDRQEVRALLARLVAERSLLLATSLGFGEPARTALLGVEAERDRLAFDELMPMAANRLLAPDQTVRLHGWLDGVEVDFTTEIQRGVSGENNACFTTRLPSAIRYRQRRVQYRVRLQRPSAPVSATISPDTPRAREAEVLDLSAGGVGLLVPGQVDYSWRERYDCILHLPDTALPTVIEPRSIRSVGKNAHTRIGARFADLQSPERGALERYIASCQRELLRERRRGRGERGIGQP